MVLLRTFLILERSCTSRTKFDIRNKLIYAQNYLSQPRKFCTTPNFCTRGGRWQKKAQIESFQPQVENLTVESENLNAGRLVKPFFFTIAFSTASISGAAIWQYENSKSKNHFPQWRNFESHKYGHWRNKSNSYWNSLSSASQIFIPICIANLLIFGAWRIPSMQVTMVRYFCSNPAAKKNCWPMVLSTFSHYSVLHIFANMYVLQSFANAATISMGKEHFLGFYMAAGVISSFTSYIHKVVAQRAGLSLGASGAIMAILGYSCVTYPDLQLSILFLPFFTFKAGMAIKVIMGIDLAGILMGWRFFDHAAHLGGAAFGVFWALWGNQHIWQKRDVLVLKYWRALKKMQ